MGRFVCARIGDGTVPNGFQSVSVGYNRTTCDWEYPFRILRRRDADGIMV